MSEVFKVHILPSNIRTCFFYLNDSDLRCSERHGCAIKLTFGSDRQKFTYGCISLTPVAGVPSKSIGVSALYSNKLGLQEGEIVLVSHCNVDSIDSLEILPKKEEDYVILLSCKSILETYLLNQVSVVAEGQTLPLYVFSNISIDVEIGKLNLPSGYGQLEKFTKITVLHPSEKQMMYKKKETESDMDSDIKREKHIFAYHFYNQLSKLLESSVSVDQINKQKGEEIILKHLLNDISSTKREYKILPFFLFPHEQYKNIDNRFMLISNLEHNVNCDDLTNTKILVKIEKVISKKEDNLSENEKEKENLCFYTYAICLPNNESNIAFCPMNLMNRLKLFGGSKITVEQVEPFPGMEVVETSEAINCQYHETESFWKRLGDMREKIRQTLINNFKYNYKINSLIIGGEGTGKTFFLTDIVNEFTSKFIFCKTILCKSLRGKKIEKIHKILMDAFKECAFQEPSLLVLDDLHALTYIDEDEGPFNRLYSEHIVHLVTKILLESQEKYNISVICSAVNMSHLSTVVSQHGPRLFQDVFIIPDLNLNERNFALKTLINQKIGITKNCSVDLDELSQNTKGYAIQDLNDLVEKAVFNCLLRSETEETSLDVCQTDFDLALSELTPLNLRNVKLKQNSDIKWENVGGMSEPKKILTEVFSWPLKYPNILETCPLRLQRGVLLYGAPGTGKTLLAGALANKCGLNFISVKGPEVLSKYVGASEEGVRNLFLQAEKTQPCLLFFDEFDSLAPKRGHDNTGVTDRVVNQLLTQLDGVESLQGVWVLAATSRPDLLDPALLRPGRLDKMVFCDVPNQDDRLSILEILSQNLSKGEDVNLLEIAEKSEGYTGADLQAVLYNAQMLVIKEEKNSLGTQSVIKVHQSHLTSALSEVKPSLSLKENQRYKTIYERFLNSRKRNFVESYEGSQRVTLA